LKNLEILEREGLAERAKQRGRQLLAGLQSLRESPNVGDVRGLGLMIGVEFTNPDGSPGGSISNAVKKACFDKNLLLLQCGTYHQVIRWIPPIDATAAEISEAVEIFGEALRTV
jgi:4-aminobutyrate aminotransferase